MNKNAIQGKNESSWYAVAAHNDWIILAGQSGKFVAMKPGENNKSKFETDLDLPLVVAMDFGFASIGRWNTKLMSWSHDFKEKKILSPHLFNGRSDVLLYHNSIIYVSGANMDTTKSTESNRRKDQVTLLPGILYKIESSGHQEKIELNNHGQIIHLAIGEGWMAWVDSKNQNEIIVRSEKNGTHSFTGSSIITSVCTENEVLYFVDNHGIMSINPIDMKKKIIHEFSNIDDRILKLIKVNKYFFGMTSEGVIRIPGENKINRKEGQPADITANKDEIIALWADGSIEIIKMDRTVY